MTERPLVVDLDGTLVLTDLLHESMLGLLRQGPRRLVAAAKQLVAGRAQFKRQVAEFSTVNAETLPYNPDLLSWLQVQSQAGRRLILCTASDEKVANAVAAHLGIFDEVLASDGQLNLKGPAKAELLRERFGSEGFDYVGDSRADFPVWAAASRAIVIDGSGDFTREVAKVNSNVERISRPGAGVGDWLRLLRVQQWLKNLLLFAPFLAAHRWQEPQAWVLLAVAFVAFGLCASATYLFNDLLDIQSDRLHPRKRERAFASSRISVVSGVLVLPVILLCGMLLAAWVGKYFFVSMLVYLLLTVSYSLALKRMMLLDCLTLAVLYTLRIIAGAAALQMGVSFWLLAFSVFLFLSLAFVKRYAEMELQRSAGHIALHGRGYLTRDLPLVLSLGVCAGYLAVLVLAMYLNSEEVLLLYQTPEVVWGAVLVLLFWVSWIWLHAHRGNMHDDPLVFAIKDRSSLVAGGVFLLMVYLGTLEWRW